MPVEVKTPEGYSLLVHCKINKHRIMLIEDWHTPFGVIPKGYSPNGASIPRPFWWFSHPFAELLEGSVVHDWYYENAIADKATADLAFKEVCKAYAKINNTRAWKIWVAYQFVKRFGKGEYGKVKK